MPSVGPLRSALSLALCAVAAAGCLEPSTPPPTRTVVTADPIGAPLRDLTPELEETFTKGDALFEQRFREPQGLGPLYIRQSCASCHDSDGKGPGFVTKMVVVDTDGKPASDQLTLLPFGHTERPFTAAGAVTGIRSPGADSVRLSARVGPAVFARGFLEAIADSEIERVEAEQATRDDGISGRIHRVPYQAEIANTDSPFTTHVPGDENLIGRFGLKARLASVDEFTADAFQGDMGLTSPFRSSELLNPDALPDDAKAGIDLAVETVNATATYMRLLDLPRRTAFDERGANAFDDARCNACHTPALRTRADYPIAALADVDAPLFTDVLLHDMGEGLQDGLADLDASGTEWRTAPLVGLRHFRRYLHDGRAGSLEEAILLHESAGSEANDSIARFRALPDDERAALLAFLATL